MAGYFGSFVPLASATMYAAYQSGQNLSKGLPGPGSFDRSKVSIDRDYNSVTDGSGAGEKIVTDFLKSNHNSASTRRKLHHQSASPV
jgi:hypothetical protein